MNAVKIPTLDLPTAKAVRDALAGAANAARTARTPLSARRIQTVHDILDAEVKRIERERRAASNTPVRMRGPRRFGC